MKEINEIRDYLIKHRTNEDGDLDLKGLDFREVKGKVILTRMKAKVINNSFQRAEWIFNSWQEAKTIVK